MPFDLQPTLRGSLLELRPLRAADFDALFAVASDPLIWELHPDRERWRSERFQLYFTSAMDSGGALLALDTRDGRPIGCSRYLGYREQAREIEIGFSFLARAYWGGRYNGEMKRLMLEHAFRFVDRVIFIVGPQNWRSQRALAKIGAVPAGTTRGPSGGEERLVFEITAPMFRAGALARA